MTSRICCVATSKMPNVNARQFIYSIPVVQLDHLPHLRDTAVFIVAAPQQQRAIVFQMLIQFGCKNVLIVGDDTQAEAENNLQNTYKSGQHLNWYMESIYNKLEEMRFRVDEQAELCALNFQTFDPFRDKFRGKNLVVFATGPSCEYYEPIEDAIHVGINFAWMKNNVKLNYLVTNDYSGENLRVKMQAGFDKISDNVLISRLLPKNPDEWLNYPEDVRLRYKHVRFFYTDNSVDNPIYQDIRYHPCMSYPSSVFSALHFALFTSPKEIYLVGCDANQSYGHFYDQDEIKFNAFPHLEKLKVTYARMKVFARHYYPDTEIISINPVGLKGLFKDIYTESYSRSREASD